VRRADGMGNEIAGVTQEWKDAFSTRTRQVDAKERQLALQWELRFGREPTAREMLFIRHTARDYSRKSKDAAQIDWDAEVEKWDGTIGGRLAEVAEATLGHWQPDSAAPGHDAQEEVILAALAQVQREHSTWTRSDLMKVLGWSMGPEFAHMDPDARQDMLLAMTERAVRHARPAVDGGGTAAARPAARRAVPRAGGTGCAAWRGRGRAGRGAA